MQNSQDPNYTELIERLPAAGFIDLGFAAWETGKGLQVRNLHLLNSETPGVYVMHHEGNIQKIGKSSASLVNRLRGYRGFDKDSLSHPEFGTDMSSRRQRKVVSQFALPGLTVLALQVEILQCYIDALGFSVKRCSFDPHDLEKKLVKVAIALGHPLAFGS